MSVFGDTVSLEEGSTSVMVTSCVSVTLPVTCVRSVNLSITHNSTPKVTAQGIARVEQHLAQFGDDAANQAMIARLKAGQTSTQDLYFYMHESKESAVMRRTEGAFSDMYEWQRAAHLETLNWQKSPYSPGYESQLYHPDVIRQFPQQFNPQTWPQ